MVASPEKIEVSPSLRLQLPERCAGTYSNDWQIWFDAVEARKAHWRNIPGMQDRVFDPVDGVSPDFEARIREADKAGQPTLTSEQMILLLRSTSNPAAIPFSWYTAARAISREARADVIARGLPSRHLPYDPGHRPLFATVAAEIRSLFETGLQEGEMTSRFDTASWMLTTAAYRYGAIGVFGGFAGAEFPEESEALRQSACAHLEELHSDLFDYEQFLKSIILAQRRFFLTPQESRNLDALLARFYRVQSFYSDHLGIYAAVSLPSPFGDANRELDRHVISQAGVPLDSTIIDIAAGTGRSIVDLIGSGYTDLYAIDATPEYLKQVPLSPERKILGTWERLDEAFTAVGKPAGLILDIGRNVNSRFYETPKMLQDVVAALSPGGVYICDFGDLLEGEYRELARRTLNTFFSGWRKPPSGLHLVADSIDTIHNTVRPFPQLQGMLEEITRAGLSVEQVIFSKIAGKEATGARNVYVIARKPASGNVVAAPNALPPMPA